MGVEQAIVASSAITIGTSVFTGIEANRAGKKQAKLFGVQAELAKTEAKKEAGRLRRNFKIDTARKKLLFLSRGVGIQGSAANIIASDINLQDEEVRAVLGRGAAQSQLFSLQGDIAKSEGRAQLISSIVGGVGSAVGQFAQAKALGFFKPKLKPLANQSPEFTSTNILRA